MANDQYHQLTSDLPRSRVGYAAITITLTDEVSNYDVREQTVLFEKINYFRELVLRNVGDVGVRFNEISNDQVDLYSHEGINMEGMPIGNIFLTTSGGAIVRIWALGWN